MWKTIILAMLLGATLLGSGPVRAHAFLKTADPAVGGTVAPAPTAVVLEFTESVEPRFSTIVVTDATGGRVDRGDMHLEGGATHLAVGLQPLPPGTYKVVWHVTSTDTHKTAGDFTFVVAAVR